MELCKQKALLSTSYCVYVFCFRLCPDEKQPLGKRKGLYYYPDPTVESFIYAKSSGRRPASFVSAYGRSREFILVGNQPWLRRFPIFKMVTYRRQLSRSDNTRIRSTAEIGFYRIIYSLWTSYAHPFRKCK